MSKEKEDNMTPLERVLATVTGKLPDRVPIFPLTTSKAADILGVSLPELYQNGEYIFNGQKEFQKIVGHDYVTSFFYLVKDAEPWGAEPVFFENGAPNLKSIPFRKIEELLEVDNPSPNDAIPYNEPKKAIKLFGNSELKGKVPIIGVLTGPFSLPALLFSITEWLETLLISPELFKDIINKISPYIIEWANIQVELGVDIILIVDGVISTTVLPPDIFSEYVIPIYKKLSSSIKAPIALSSAGGEVQDVLDSIIQSGIVATTLSSNDDLKTCKEIVDEKLTLIGNLNNIEFIDWPDKVLEEQIKNTIIAGTNNLSKPGFILMNQHSFPTEVKLDQIKLMVKYGKKYGRY
ncbi:MAG: uroporphyrinogen decarboxylase family protein [Candidatus Helarchaeota archaeon]